MFDVLSHKYRITEYMYLFSFTANKGKKWTRN